MSEADEVLETTAAYSLRRTPEGTMYLETKCVGGCSRPYRIDEHHSDFDRILDMIDGGDRSALRCYHKAR